MADIYCPRCGEPVEIDYLHDVADTNASSFTEVREAFYMDGCVALGDRCNPRPNKNRAALSAALMDLLGDDVDGLAADMEDLGMFGWDD